MASAAENSLSASALPSLCSVQFTLLPPFSYACTYYNVFPIQPPRHIRVGAAHLKLHGQALVEARGPHALQHPATGRLLLPFEPHREVHNRPGPGLDRVGDAGHADG